MSFNLISANIHKAKKEHICVWCGEKIDKNEKYMRVKGVYDDNIQDQCWHLECKKASDYEYKKTYDTEFDPYMHKKGSLEGKE